MELTPQQRRGINRGLRRLLASNAPFEALCECSVPECGRTLFVPPETFDGVLARNHWLVSDEHLLGDKAKPGAYFVVTTKLPELPRRQGHRSDASHPD